MFKQIINQIGSIKLNLFDKISLSIYFLTILLYIYFNALTILTVGGLILIGGAFFTYKGKILTSVAWYVLADFCWITNAISIHDIQGAIFVTIGVTFGMIATYKMQKGTMDTELTDNKE